MLTLYYARGTIALASHIALEEAGADYVAQPLDFSHAQQRTPDYLSINPKGRVPSLVTSRGILTETPAILAYIAQIYPGAGLAPLDDPFAFAQMQAFNAYICSTLHVAHAHGPRGTRWADEPAALAELKRKVPEVMTDSFAMIENEMLRGPWVMGETYSVADPYLFTVARWIEADNVDTARIPRVLEHRQRMLERPAVAKALAAQNAA